MFVMCAQRFALFRCRVRSLFINRNGLVAGRKWLDTFQKVEKNRNEIIEFYNGCRAALFTLCPCLKGAEQISDQEAGTGSISKKGLNGERQMELHDKGFQW